MLDIDTLIEILLDAKNNEGNIPVTILRDSFLETITSVDVCLSDDDEVVVSISSNINDVFDDLKEETLPGGVE